MNPISSPDKEIRNTVDLQDQIDYSSLDERVPLTATQVRLEEWQKESLLEKSRYYWGWWELTGHRDYLASASSFYRDYIRLLPGSIPEEYRDKLDKALSAVIGNLAALPPEECGGDACFTNPPLVMLPLKVRHPDAPADGEPTIFGYTYAQIGKMQGAKPLR